MTNKVQLERTSETSSCPQAVFLGARPESGFSRKAVLRSAACLSVKAMQIVVRSVDHQTPTFCCGSVGVRREAQPRGTICG